MDKETRKEVAKEIAREVVNRLSLNVQPGSAFWRLDEVFRKKLLNDPDGNTFNDLFADGLAKLKQQSEASQKKWMLVFYISGILLLSLVGEFSIPISIPYINPDSIGNDPGSGLLEIALIAFLVAQFSLSRYGIKVSLYTRMLRTFVEIRYGEDKRDFYLLRWGVDDIVGKLQNEKYEGYVRKKDLGGFRNVLSRMYFWIWLTLLGTIVVLLVLGVLKSFLNPAFGWFTYLIIGGLLIVFLYNFIGNFTAELVDFYEYNGED